jgi:hypothetical protein
VCALTESDMILYVCKRGDAEAHGAACTRDWQIHTYIHTCVPRYVYLYIRKDDVFTPRDGSNE